MKLTSTSVLRATRLLVQGRKRIRYKHYSLRTEQAYAQAVRMFMKLHGLRHPRDIGSWKAKAFWPSWLNDDFGAVWLDGRLRPVAAIGLSRRQLLFNPSLFSVSRRARLPRCHSA